MAAMPPHVIERGGQHAGGGLYRRFLVQSEQEHYDEAQSMVGTLDQELALTRAKIAAALERLRDDPRACIRSVSGRRAGGEPGARTPTLVPLTDIVERMIDQVRKLEESRAKILGAAPSDSGDLEGYEVWIARRAEST